MEWPAWLLALWEPVRPYAEKLAIWRGYEGELTTLAIYAVGIAAYTALVFAFYQNLSKKDPFHTGWGKGYLAKLVRLAENVFVFPAMSFLYFGVLALSLFVLAKSQSTTTLILLSMSVVVGVRVTAFVSENASVDLAKLLPLSLLGVLLVDPTYATLDNTWARILEIPTLAGLLWRSFVLLLVLETALQGFQGSSDWIRKGWANRKARKPKRKELVDSIGAAHDAPVRTLTPTTAKEGPAAADDPPYPKAP